ncbi:MAG: DsbA family protein [Hyphomonadaceae bacterium]|nr:DsbA family protein [Hyphomonadaceae bacterium]
MTLEFDYYFSFRRPYSYLAAAQVEQLIARYDMKPRMRIVTPIAIRIPGFFKSVNPLWPPYLLRDTFRIAQMHNIPYRWPRPDPIIMDITSGEVAAEQPYIHRVSRMGAAATRAGRGFEFARRASHKIWSGEVDAWHEGDHLANAATEAGLDPAALEAAVRDNGEALAAEITQNESDQRNAGHWGVPLFVFENEPFFGQDRLDHLVWRLKQAGLKER